MFKLDQILTDLFDLQRFSDHRALRAVIEEVEQRYEIQTLDDEELADLAAAGDPYAAAAEQPKKGAPQ